MLQVPYKLPLRFRRTNSHDNTLPALHEAGQKFSHYSISSALMKGIHLDISDSSFGTLIYQLKPDEHVVFVDTTGATGHIDLPRVESAEPAEYIFVLNADGGGGLGFFITTPDSALINGLASLTVAGVVYRYSRLVCNGTDWVIVG